MPARLIRSLLILLTSQVSHLVGQTSVPQSTYEALRDSLTRVSDTAELKALSRRSKSDPIRFGLVALRLGELGSDADFSLALSSFRKATRKEPRRPEAWFGLAAAETGRSEWEMQDRLRLGSRVGLGTLQRAADHYRRALENDPRFLPAAPALAQLELSLLDTTRLRRAATVLQRAVAAAVSPNPELLLAWGRVARAAGQLHTSATTFEEYLAAGGNRALGLLELARTRLALGQPSGDSSYFAGAALDDPVATAGYRGDLQIIAADSVLSELDQLTGQRRAAFLHRFWTDRDHLELRREGERLREHYRRLLYARAHFPLTVTRRFYGRYDAYRSGSLELDDRGIIYIRQGEPATRLRPFIFGAMPNESWRYVRADGDLLFHFSAGYDDNGGGDLYDYRLVESVLDLRGAADAPRDQLILSRQSLSPVYSRMLNWGAYGAAHEQARERNIGAASIAFGTTTDSHELRFHRRVRAVGDLIAVGRNSQGSLGHYVFGISAEDASWRRGPGGVEYPVRVRLVALDRHDRSVATLDTSVMVQVPNVLTRGEYIVGRVELSLPPGRWSYRAAVQQGDSGGVVLPRDTVLVAPIGEPSLSLSDLALGSPGRAVRWVTDIGDTVLLAPSSLVRERSEVEIYYEAGGAAAGSHYLHQITIFQDAGRKSSDRALVALSFVEAAGGSVIRSRRTVQLKGMKKGSYVVEVKVTGPSGETQVRRRSLTLIAK